MQVSNSFNTRVNQIFNIKHPVIQGGMIWCAGWELASSVSNAGGLGLIGAGSMQPEILREHIRKAKKATKHPFGVNVPLLYPHTEDIMKIILQEEVKIVFTSAGNPAKWTPVLQKEGIKVAHVVANLKNARKCEEAGVDAIVAEGFEAGGHNGREETTTMVLIPLLKQKIKKPLIAAGGIGTGRSMLAAFALGAEGVQVGSRFVASEESSAHPLFKQKIIESPEGETQLALKKLIPVRLLKNSFYEEIEQLTKRGAGVSELVNHLGKGRAKKGMFEGDILKGELEIGQVASLIRQILPVSDIMETFIADFFDGLNEIRDQTG